MSDHEQTLRELAGHAETLAPVLGPKSMMDDLRAACLSGADALARPAALSSAPPDLVALRLVLKCAERACVDDNTDVALDYVREAIRHVDKLAPAPPVAETPEQPFLTLPAAVAVIRLQREALKNLRLACVDADEDLPPQIDGSLLDAASFAELAADAALEDATALSPASPVVAPAPVVEHETVDVLATTDAAVWAKEWCRIAREIDAAKDGRAVIDEGWMLSWFANAIMKGWDAHAALSPCETPDSEVPPSSTWGDLGPAAKCSCCGDDGRPCSHCETPDGGGR